MLRKRRNGVCNRAVRVRRAGFPRRRSPRPNRRRRRS
jgi:hypothetical protein